MAHMQMVITSLTTYICQCRRIFSSHQARIWLEREWCFGWFRSSLNKCFRWFFRKLFKICISTPSFETLAPFRKDTSLFLDLLFVPDKYIILICNVEDPGYDVIAEAVGGFLSITGPKNTGANNPIEPCKVININAQVLQQLEM